MFYVYVLLSQRDGNIYTGYTSDLKRRIFEHKSGNVKSTSLRKPLKLIYYEAYLSKIDAIQREKYLKGGGKAKNILKEQIKASLKS